MKKKIIPFIFLIVSVVIIIVVGINRNQAPDDSNASDFNGLSPKVLVVIYYKGHDPDKSYDVNNYIKEVEKNIEEATAYKKYQDSSAQPYVDYQLTIVVKEETAPQKGDNCNQYLQKIWAGDWTTSDWESTNCWGSGTADYKEIIDDNNICKKVNDGSVDEVWLAAFGYGGFWEAVMTGKNAYETNGPVITGTSCNRPINIMGFTYEREQAVAMEDFVHRIEGTILHFMSKDYKEFDTLKYRYSYPFYVDYPLPTNPSCGNAHWAPNGRHHYDYTNQEYVYSDCNDWNVKHTGQRENINCTSWGCSHLGYMKWWMQHIPGPNNGLTRLNGKTMPNWWDFIIYSKVIQTTPTPTPIPTTIIPTPSPTIVPTETTVPTLTPTPTIVPTSITPTPTLIVSPTTLPSESVECGPMDNPVINSSDIANQIDLRDLAAFVKVYGTNCSDTPTTTGCKGKDTNNDGKITLVDLANLSSRYGKPNCGF